MAKYIPKIVEPILNYVPDKGISEGVSIASKVMRAKIITDRYIRGFEKIDRDGGSGVYEHEDERNRSNQSEYKDSRVKLRDTKAARKEQTTGYTHEATGREQRKPQRVESIHIIDLDFNDKKHREKRRYRRVTLPFIPRSVSYQPTSNFVGIASFGRNNPFYQFTGSEDTVSFTVDWYSMDGDLEKIITQCRWLEALTKNDGYTEAPHRVKIIWGSNGLLFGESIWVLTAAPYTLNDFSRGYMNGSREFVNHGLLPKQAIQQLTFKRLTINNRTSSEIINNTQ